MAPAVIPVKALAGGLVVLLGWNPAKDHRLLKGVSNLECLHKDLHATTGMSPESLPHGGSGLKGDLLRRRGASCRGKGLVGAAKAGPGKDLVGAAKTGSRQGSRRGNLLRPFALCGLGFGLQVHQASVLPWLTSLAMVGVVLPMAQTARAQS